MMFGNIKKVTAIIILNYNNCDDTISCIKSVEKYNTSSIRYIIVDNGSNIITKNKLENFLYQEFNDRYLRLDDDEYVEKLPYVTFLSSKTNDGYAKGNNKGIKLAIQDKDIDYILILNNDILFYADIIGRLSEFYEKHTDIGVVSPLLYTKSRKKIDYTCARKSPSDWSLLIKYLAGDVSLFGFNTYMDSKYYLLKGKERPKTAIKVDLPSGSCMFINKDLFRTINWFDENTFLYYEENILYKKLSAYGKQNYILPNIGCIHLGASSTKSKPSSFLIKCNSDSAFYYLSNYCQLNVLQKMVLYIAKKIMHLKYLMFKKKERK